MHDIYDKAHFRVTDIAAAASLLTRLPMPIDHAEAGSRARQAVWAYPLVGAALGAAAGCLGHVALLLHVDPGITAALVLGGLILATGALHEDGLADCADGLAGGQDRAKRLAIMKDSRIGAFGATALVLVLLARWSALETLVTSQTLLLPLIAIGAASRLPMVAAMAMMDQARSDGLAAGVGRPPRQSFGLAVLITTILCLLAFGFSGFALLFWALLAALPLLLIARKLINGITGDILGGAQQLGEIAALSAAIALLN